jgi:hypothetical protein
VRELTRRRMDATSQSFVGVEAIGGEGPWRWIAGRPVNEAIMASVSEDEGERGAGRSRGGVVSAAEAWSQGAIE